MSLTSSSLRFGHRGAQRDSTTSEPLAKRRRIDARTIHAQPVDETLANGELDVGKFIKAREFEITALDDALKSARTALATQAFQELPISMRRRTASHNVKRLPKRLRTRALGEVSLRVCVVSVLTGLQTGPEKLPGSKKQKVVRRAHLRKLASRSSANIQQNESGRAKGKGKISRETYRADQKHDADKSNRASKRTATPKKPIVTGKFKKRQASKTWLPTHLFHAKRAHMTPPSEPFWGFSIPLTPTDKVFRVSHRATSLRGAVAWDTSYMSTVSLEGRGDSIAKLLRSIGVGKSQQEGAIWGDPGARWRRGTRTWRGWLHGRDSYPHCPITPATVIWSAEDLLNPPGSSRTSSDLSPKKISKRTVFVRFHPAAFVQLWQLLLQLAKVQKPSITVHDLRYEIGSLEVTGPNSTEALVSVLRPAAGTNNYLQKISLAASVWDSLALVTNPSFLPKNVLIAFDAIDPRLRPCDRAKADLTQMPQVVDMCSQWPLDDFCGPISLFDRALRTKSNSSLLSDKIINQKLGEELDRSATPNSLASAIPLVLFPTHQGHCIQSSWVVLLPWSRVKSVWQSLMHCPLSNGSTVRFGGLSEAHQAAHEAGTAWFPADYPGTDAGFQWELRERKKLEAEWTRKPKGRRVEYETLDLGLGRNGETGRGWACDWETLVPMKSGNWFCCLMDVAYPARCRNRTTAAVAVTDISKSADSSIRSARIPSRSYYRKDHYDFARRASEASKDISTTRQRHQAEAAVDGNGPKV
jgi:ribonuclease P/MRP protein subunit POP1